MLFADLADTLLGSGAHPLIELRTEPVKCMLPGIIL